MSVIFVHSGHGMGTHGIMNGFPTYAPYTRIIIRENAHWCREAIHYSVRGEAYIDGRKRAIKVGKPFIIPCPGKVAGCTKMMHSRFHRLLTSKAKRIILTTDKKNRQSYEQEEYIALHGHRESGAVKTRSSAVMEWACKLKSKRSALV